MTARYQSGFANHFETEALEGALPQGRNSPQRPAFGLYAEQISGTAFTAPRGENRRSWLYRIRPSVKHIAHYGAVERGLWLSAPVDYSPDAPLGPMRWDPVKPPAAPHDLIEGVRTVTAAGDVRAQEGVAVHLFSANKAMADRYFYSADGEMLFAPQAGGLVFRTEMGTIEAAPGEIVVIPRGVKFAADPAEGTASGYMLENYGEMLRLPERGPIGANALANERDFLYPVAAYEDRDEPSTLTVKWGGRFFMTELPYRPLDVVAWHGNYAPYKYDLRRFNTIGSISFDHPDPSIFTVLTSPSGRPGTANADFVIFPDRWLVAEDTFRPPWFHMNVMSEFMGLIHGVYDAKPGGFAPGGFSLHNSFLPHGPDREAFEAATKADLKPHKLEGTLAFMFETRLPQQVTDYAARLDELQTGYVDVWESLEKRFNKSKR